MSAKLVILSVNLFKSQVCFVLLNFDIDLFSFFLQVILVITLTANSELFFVQN